MRKRVKNGVVESYHRNGNLEERASYKKGKLHGLLEAWYENGQLQHRCSCKDGYIDGLAEWWHINGQMSKQAHYKDGILNGLSEEWYENGQLQHRCSYKDGEADGLVEWWHENGQLWLRGHYKNDLVVGLTEKWDEHGQLVFRGDYQMGRPHGFHDERDNSGKLISRKYYEAGEEVAPPPFTPRDATDWKEWEQSILVEGVESVVESDFLKELEPYIMDALKGYESPSTYFFALESLGLEGMKERSNIGIEQFDYESLLILYARNVVEIERGLREDATTVAEEYSELLESKSYPEVAIDQHLKNLSSKLSLELDNTLDEIIKYKLSLLRREDIADGLNSLESPWVVEKAMQELQFGKGEQLEHIGERKKSLQPKLSSIVAEAEQVLGSDWKREKVSDEVEQQNRGLKL